MFAPAGGFSVRIMDLSGANGSDPVEVVKGFPSLMQANAFARRYVRDSIERCRTRGMSAAALRDTWFLYGEDAVVEGEGGWRSANELPGFLANVASAEDRNWRALDPRRQPGDEDEE
jgi:hypothetical protein